MVYLIIFLINFNGPVGSYLGIFQGKWALDTISICDTIHYFYPSETTEVYFYDGIARESIVKETVWQGNIAYLQKTSYSEIFNFNLLFFNIFSKKKFSPRKFQESYDTLFEYGPYLCWNGTFFDTIIIQETLYKTPFSINLKWGLGLRGRLFILDLDGEGILNDTITFLADTCRVISIENVQTPYGLIPNAYKIRNYTVIRVAGVYSSFLWRDTARMNGILWYKDSLWQVKDSSYINERMWFNIGTWILLVEGRRRSKGYLKDIFTGIFEKEDAKIKTLLWQNSLIIDFKEKEGEIILTNSLGQILYKKTIKEKIILDNKKYQKGIYYLKMKNKEKEELFKLIIM